MRALQGVSLTIPTGLVRHRHRHERLGQIDAAQRRRRHLPRRPGSIALDGTDVTRWPEHRRASLIGRVFQNPFSGTAPNMTIAENLALAARRGQGARAWAGAQSTASRNELRDRIRPLQHGPGRSARQPDRQPLRRPAPGADAADGVVAQTRSCCCSTSTPRRSTPKSADQVIRLTDEIIARDKLTTLMVTHSMQQAVNLGDRLIMMHRGRVLHDLQGSARAARAGLRTLLSRFEDVRRREQLDGAVAEMLACTYI